MKADVVILTLVFLCGLFVYADGCSCMPQHPQVQFCNADFVILARVKREKVLSDSKVYKVRVKKEYKVSEKGLLALKSGRLISAADESMCGVKLQLGKLYVLSGRIHSLKAHINLCGMITEWESLTRRQRKGLKLLYRHGCSCDIKRCPLGRRCYRQRDSCNWRNDCEIKEGVCLRQSNKSCMWTRTKALTQCTREWRQNATNSRGYRYNKSLFYH
ncbi:unnamed protein product [Phaedon cochleariae]|uniref:NTR domain-containing protein n=1 Tax=Phaedon cochleariae TaxID=80249 RepID=A0A9P0DN47_PHACE|nr:unnamed protein product [Phaedon cochleariae]